MCRQPLEVLQYLGSIENKTKRLIAFSYSNEYKYMDGWPDHASMNIQQSAGAVVLCHYVSILWDFSSNPKPFDVKIY